MTQKNAITLCILIILAVLCSFALYEYVSYKKQMYFKGERLKLEAEGKFR